jgi:hypothetical protein
VLGPSEVRLSNITVQPSPRPIAQLCPSPRGNRRALASSTRYGFNTEGFTYSPI